MSQSDEAQTLSTEARVIMLTKKVEKLEIEIDGNGKKGLRDTVTEMCTRQEAIGENIKSMKSNLWQIGLGIMLAIVGAATTIVFAGRGNVPPP